MGITKVNPIIIELVLSVIPTYLGASFPNFHMTFSGPGRVSKQGFIFWCYFWQN